MQVYSNKALSQEIIDWPVTMQRALMLAARVMSAAPNPRVGCVIVCAEGIVGEGWHSAAGQPHAEIEALRMAGNAARNATVFVTLEPCAHHGRTGPCADALIAAGVARVVIAGIDPNPAVAGKGIARLEAVGIEVAHLVDFEAAAQSLNRGYFKRRQFGRPWVTCKLAMSIDGRTALANGPSKWITGGEARADVQRLRARSCAIVTGIATVLFDDPSLTVRPAELQLSAEAQQVNALALRRQPLRVILDSKGRVPANARILGDGTGVKVYIGRESQAPSGLPAAVQVLPVAANRQGVDLLSVLESLASDFECNEILVEAGSTLSSAFISAGLVDELIVYIAPKLLGSDARALFEASGLTALTTAPQFELADVERFGNDVRLTLHPQYGKSD